MSGRHSGPARTLPVNDSGVLTRPSLVASWLTAAGAPPSAVIGVRHAFERSHGQLRVPARAALLGIVLGVTALCGTAVFGASLSNLVDHPDLYGVLYQLDFNNVTSGSALEHEVVGDPSVSAVGQGFGSQVGINQVAVGALALSSPKGRPLIRIIDGHYPSAPGQIALGADTMRQANAHVGSTIELKVQTPQGKSRTSSLVVVGQAAIPLVSGNTSIGNGVVLSQRSYIDAACPPGRGRVACQAGVTATTNQGMIVSTQPDQAGHEALARYLQNNPSIASTPETPTSLVNFGQAVNFPLVFAMLLSVFAVATLVHVLVLSVVRNRREFGILKVLGLLRRQIAFTVSWQATAAALVGVIVGLPLGIALGRTVWSAFAANLGVVPQSVVPTELLVIMIASVLLVANAVAVLPAYLATRSRARDQLSELGTQ